MALEKNLANCTPEEFLTQSNRIRKSAERWLKATDVMNIRKNVPKLDLPEGLSKEETSKRIEEHDQKVKEAARKNFSDMLDSILEKHPKETLELLALISFVEPNDVNSHPITDYLTNVTEVMNDESVLSFFTSLTRLGQIGTLLA